MESTSCNLQADSITTTNTQKTSSMGRRKIEIKKIEKKAALSTTFSKRRRGLFSKAKELCTLCDAETAVLVFSPNGKVHTFGHPSESAVIDKYLHGINPSLQEAKSSTNNEDNGLHGDQKEEERATETNEREGFWWEEPIENIRLEELESYTAALVELKKKVAMRVEEMMIMPNVTAMVQDSLVVDNGGDYNFGFLPQFSSYYNGLLQL